MHQTRTLSTHAHFETLFEAAVLALVPVVLVDRAVSVSATRVRQVAAHAALEERLASLAGELAVVLARTLVATHDALDVRVLSVLVRRRRRVRRTRGQRRRQADHQVGRVHGVSPGRHGERHGAASRPTRAPATRTGGCYGVVGGSSSSSSSRSREATSGRPWFTGPISASLRGAPPCRGRALAGSLGARAGPRRSLAAGATRRAAAHAHRSRLPRTPPHRRAAAAAAAASAARVAAGQRGASLRRCAEEGARRGGGG